MPPFPHFLVPRFLVVLLALSPVSAPDSQAALQKAAALVQQGRLEEADQQARIALADPETRAGAYSVLGTIRLRQNRLDESAAMLQKAIQLEPRLVGARLSLAQVYSLQGKPALAPPLFRKVLEIDPGNTTARLGLARDQMASGNKAAAAEMTRQWLALGEVGQASSIEFALVLLKGGAVTDGITVLERAKATTPPSYELAFNLGSAYLLHDDLDKALDAYEGALSLAPESTDALQQAAALAERQGQLERSLSYWIRLKKLQPDAAATLFGFGRVCLKMDLLEDAEPALAKAASLEPDNPKYQYALAAAKVGKRQFDAAQQVLETLVVKQPRDPQLQYALGSVLYLQGRLPEAADHLRESTRLQPDQVASNYYLALVARDQGNDAEAIDILQRLLERHPDHAPSCEALGGLLVGAQRYEEAEVQLRKAVGLNAASVKAHYQLGLLLSRMGKKEEADAELALSKSLRKGDEENSRLQLRLLEGEP